MMMSETKHLACKTRQKQYFEKVDFRSRHAMIEFLKNHFRYNTMNSWNRSTSYANNIKIYNLGLDKETENKMYDMINADSFWNEVNYVLNAFAVKYNHRWQIGTNGRNSGYLVLYQGYIEPTEHKSYCTECGQQNFTSVIENNNICGKCGQATRVDYKRTPMRVGVYTGRSIDMDEDFVDFTMYELREKVKLVQAFDKVADDLLAMVVGMCNNYTVKDETYYVPKTRKVLVANGGVA